MFSAAQLRVLLRSHVYIAPYSFLEEVASHFAGDNENALETGEDIVLHALDNTSEGKLVGFALGLTLTDQVGLPGEGSPDPLIEAEAVFASPHLSKAKSKTGFEPKKTSGRTHVPTKKTSIKNQSAA